MKNAWRRISHQGLKSTKLFSEHWDFQARRCMFYGKRPWTTIELTQKASLRQMLNIQPGPANWLCSSYATFCAVRLCLIVFNLLQLHFAFIRVCGSSISDNTLVEPLLRRIIRSAGNTRMPGRVTGYVRERSILVWTVITLCAEN